MLRLARLLALLVIVASMIVMIYGGYAVLLTRQIKNTMAVSSSVPVSFTRVKPYMDGVVIDTMNLGDHIKLSTIYFEGYPWQILRDDIQHIYIKRAQIRAEKLLDQPLIWPFEHDTPLTIETATIALAKLGQEIVLTGEVKQSPNIPLLLKLTSSVPEITLDMQGEIRVQDYMIQSVDLEFHDAQLAFEALQTKRSSGWLSLTFSDSTWNIVGEMESGFVKIPQQSFFDTTVKLSGTPSQMDFVVSGNEQATKNAWVMERQNKDVHIRYLDQVKTIAWNGMNNNFLHKTGSLMTTFKTDDLPQEKVEEKVEEKSVQIAESKAPKKDVKDTKTEAVKKKELAPEKEIVTPIENDAEEDVDTEEVVSETSVADMQTARAPQAVAPQVVYVPIQELLGNSVFQGFLYDRHLVVMPRVCVNNPDAECWTARGQGGRLGYNTNDPWAVPSYFSRLKNYQEATQLRSILASLPIDTLILNGDENGIRDMTIHGRDAQGRTVYIELSVLGLSAD